MRAVLELGVPPPEWERYVEERFPSYLLPAAAQTTISKEAAERFLSHFVGEDADLQSVCAAALFSTPASQQSLHELTTRWLPSLLRQLPGTTRVERKEWEGGFRGRLDLNATLALHRAGKPTRFVTRSRRRHYELPETLLVAAVTTRLRALIRELRQRMLINATNWGAPLLEIQTRLETLLLKTTLKEIPVVRIGREHVEAARRARHPAYGLCAHWATELRRALDEDDTRAAYLCRGALIPLDSSKRFQIAVLARLVEVIHDALERSDPGRWTYECGAIQPNRSDIAALVDGRGRAIRFHYDRAVLEPGERDELVAHYFAANSSRARPDVTITFEAPGQPLKACVVEVKQSSLKETVIKGVEEAIVYRQEYAAQLFASPKAIVVAEGGVVGAPRPSDGILVLNWADLLPGFVVEALVGRARDLAA